MNDFSYKDYMCESKNVYIIAVHILKKIDELFLKELEMFLITKECFNEYDLAQRIKSCIVFNFIETCNKKYNELTDVEFKDDYFISALLNPERTLDVVYSYWYRKIGKDKLWCFTQATKEQYLFERNLFTLNLSEESYTTSFDNLIRDLNDEYNKRKHIEL